MNDVLIRQFIQLIWSHTGLHIREQDGEALCKKIWARMKLLNLTVPENYYQLLQTGKNHNSLGETLPFGNPSGSGQPLRGKGSLLEYGDSVREWRELTRLLTTGESYFFRDQGQLTLLKTRILPELIEHRKKAQYAEGEAKPSLRIWSAGCSTGEEPYSLAILVKELIPDCDKWNILILGTDINPESIEKAKRGIYDEWSFRMVERELQRRYFYQWQTSWKIDEPLRRMVTFRSGNLIKDHFPSFTSGIHNVDILLCRNVFIYFDSKAVSVVLEKFYNTLRPGGYLIAGHTELHGQNLSQLQTKVFPQSVVYQRGGEGEMGRGGDGGRGGLGAPSGDRGEGVPFGVGGVWGQGERNPLSSHYSQKRSRVASSPCPPLSPSPPLLAQAETLLHNGAYAIAIKEAEQVIKQHPHHFGAYYLIAQAFANLGECEQAIHWCQQALKVDSLSVSPYYLLAHIAEEDGDILRAKELFKKIIYLAPSSIAAYLELGCLYESEGDAARARKMRSIAVEMLAQLPDDVPVEFQAKMTASELLLHVKKLL